MKRFLVPSALVFAALLLFSSCILDPKKEPPGNNGGNTGTYKSLKEKDDVLENLELLYNQRNETQYARLLDENFTFFFSPTDFAEGKTPPQWGRIKELSTAHNMFNPSYVGPENPITRINLVLSYTAGDQQWSATSPDSGYGGETWYEKTANYDLIVTTTSRTINALDMQALFVIRRCFVPLENDTLWQIIKWYDLGGS
jgi:hypothetical protein